MNLASIHIYPIKSTAPIDVGSSVVDKRGLANDRRFLVVDEQRRFLTARRYPALLKIASAFREGAIEVSAPGAPSLVLPVHDDSEPDNEVNVWGDAVGAVDMGNEAADWFSAVIEFGCRLVHMSDRCRRAVDPDFAGPQDEVSFADGYPLLATTVASLDDLNARLARPVTMRRFRPNLVIEGSAAYAEDRWNRLHVGEVEFEVAKPCDRCVMTTVDPDKAARDPDGEPLATLSSYRDDPERGVLFGVNLIPRSAGVVRTGDRVTVA